MIYKLFMSVYKEFLLLRRDIGGVIILFVMPLMLIVTVTLIQDSTFKKIKESKIPILLVDNDKGNVSKSIYDSLGSSDIFSAVTTIDDEALTEEKASELVLKGKYQLAIIIPKNLSTDLQNKIDKNVEKVVSSLGSTDTDTVQKAKTPEVIEQKEVRLYFDPAVQLTFENAVMNTVDKMIAQIETHSIYSTFQAQLGENSESFEQKSFITFKEIVPRVNDKEVLPNSVQHNVPAWTLFAIFFIIIPLSINMVKEKTQGTFVRLRTNPVSNGIVLGGKTLMYLIICMVQFYMMVALAVFVFPHLGLPPLNIEGKLFLASIVALFAGFAAIGLGILIGTVAKTQEQSAPFGATITMILGAIGGIWVPVFAMPKTMQMISMTSPMNWGLNAFYDVLLRSAGIVDILPEIGLLFMFFILTITIALAYDKRKRAV